MCGTNKSDTLSEAIAKFISAGRGIEWFPRIQDGFQTDMLVPDPMLHWKAFSTTALTLQRLLQTKLGLWPILDAR